MYLLTFFYVDVLKLFIILFSYSRRNDLEAEGPREPCEIPAVRRPPVPARGLHQSDRNPHLLSHRRGVSATPTVHTEHSPQG